ncbi:GNAT family N-acetyltransferase [Burkholderia sp. L27(2015)]|uniref:GNAT family N-acetyltransferase n=1 Tax=Burkholderia sp. L27(2015) TaxID=1641858 RepID=UPI00131E86FE|nr:GNAT family N-acetyltransferase [Burkholderia sp. L27(2015)]
MVVPSPESDAIKILEECAMNAWPAHQSVLCDGWVLRLAAGYTKRANSANALFPTGRFSEIVPLIEAFYARHALPTVFRLSPLAGTEPASVLDAAGYRYVDPTLVMTLALSATLPAACASTRASELTALDDEVVIEPTASAEWREGFARANAVAPASRPVHDRMLGLIALPAAFATLTRNGVPIAYGLAVAERGNVGLFDIVVTPAERGRGAGQKLIAGLLRWGQGQGAAQAYLQVTASNTAAVGLYRKLGFALAYEYHYRVRA